MSSIFFGIFFHAIGGIAAASCYLPQKGTKRWSYQTYWLLFCFVAWLVTPIVVASVTVPNLLLVLGDISGKTMWTTILLGALYGFGGMAFALAIRHIGFSLTYAIAIGISAVLGTIIPAAVNGTLVESFSGSSGKVILIGSIIAIVGVIICGVAGVLKDKSVSPAEGEKTFNIRKGLPLTLIAGVLSAVFGLALAAGSPIDVIAASYGAGQYQSNAKYIFAMGGAFATNLLWWSVVHIKQGTFKEYVSFSQGDSASGSMWVHYAFGILSGVLWYVQFFFYGVGHGYMLNFGFISWGIHMSMLIFFSFGIGYLLGEWSGLTRKILNVLFFGLFVLFTSFVVITYGTWVDL